MTPTVPFRLPWSAFCAALVAFGALAFTSSSAVGYGFLGFCTVMMAATYFLPQRLPDTTIPVAQWAVRFVVYTAIWGVSGGFTDAGAFFADPQHGAVVFGCLSASEVVLQCWRERPAGNPLGVSLVYFTGVVFVTACYSFSVDVFRLVTPIYFLLMALSLHAFTDTPPTRGKSVVLGMLIARASAIALSLAIGSVIYAEFYIHRSDLTTWGQNFLQGKPTPEMSGVSEDPTLATTYGTQGSPRRVLFIAGESGPIYLRGLAYDAYARGRWAPSADLRRYTPISPMQVGAFVRGKGVRVTRLADADGLLFAPLETAGIRPLQQEDLEWSGDSSGPLKTRTLAPSDYEYVRPASGQETGIWAAPLLPADRNRMLALPSDLDPKIRDLARQIAGTITDPEQKIAAVERYLPANHAYSLTFTAGPGDPLASFLLSKRAAHCEYFASGTVVLLRCLGVPSRYVTGYYAHEGEGNGVAVRQRDSHAWAEAWVDGKGWVTVDSTPAGGRPDELFGSEPSWQHGAEEFEDSIRNLRNWVAQRKPVQVWTTLGLIAAVYLGITAWRETRLIQRKRFAAFKYTSPEELAALEVRFEAVLRRDGLSCPPGITWEEHLRRVAREDNAAPRPAFSIDAAAEFVRAYNAARFGDSPSSLDDLESRLQELERTKTPAVRS
jgi:transglutaminase-like putative cysteine protease